MERKLTIDNLQNAVIHMEWSMDKVGEVFSDYCEVFGIHRAYGVESYNFSGDIIRIKQDTSARSCYNYEQHDLPYRYFIENKAKRLKLMNADRKELAEKKRLKKLQEDKMKLKSLEKEAEELRNKLNG